MLNNKKFQILFLSLGAALVSSCSTNLAGRSQMLLYSEPEMAQLGVQSFEEMKKNTKISTDKRVNKYVQCVSDRIIYALGESPKNWEVVVFDSKEVNAFALPGGKIGVYTGLLKVADNQDELATVIGHEVAHVLAKHGNERASRSQATNVGLEVANVGMQVAGVSNTNLYMQGLSATAQVAFLLPFSRLQESEADSLGLELMAKAGFNPKESITLWHNMDKLGSSGASILSTHPSNSDRAEQLEKLQEKVTPYYLSAKDKKQRCTPL